MKKLSKLFFFLTLLYTPSTVEGADYLPSTETIKTFGQTVIAAKNITLANAPFPKVLTYGGRFVVDVATAFGAVAYFEPTSFFTVTFGGLVLWVSGQRIMESATSYFAWLNEKSKSPASASELGTDPKENKKE